MAIGDMEHTDTSGEGALESKPVLPAAGQSRWRWALVVAVVVLTVVAAVLLVLYLQALGDRDDSRQALSEAEGELSATEAALGESRAELDASEAALGESQAALDASEAALGESQVALDERTSQLSEAEQATTDFLVTTFTTGFAIDERTAGCIAASMYDEHGPTILSDLAAAGESSAETSAAVEFQLAVVQAAETCGTTMEELADTVVVPSSPDAADQPTATGSAIDALYAECAAGSGNACDALLMFAEPFSEEETFALTCGNRFDIEDAPLTCEGNM